MRRAALVFLLLLTASKAAPDGAALQREIDRLDAALKAIPAADLPNEVQGAIEPNRQLLDRARKASSPEYRLYRLRDAFVGVETLAFVAREKASSESVDAFARLWSARRARFEAKPARPRGTLLQRALMESASTRAERLFRASLPYSKASAPWSGVYYLGEAEANLRFREFVQSIAAGDGEKSPSLAALAAALDSVERDTLQFFAGDVTNQAVIPVSARLKEARELLDAHRLDGAALLLVEARLALTRRGGKASGGLENPPYVSHGTSIAALLESWADDEPSPMKEKIRSDVVPFYASLLLPAAAARKAPAAVTVTLVRWPYT